MTYDFDYLVFAGRFSPFTLAHKHVVEEAALRARKIVMLVGSCFQASTPRTPWNFEERALMIRLGLPEEIVRRLEILPLMDYDNDEEWVTRVRELVGVFAQPHDKIGLIGHAKDHTSFYLKLFPEWGSVDVQNFEDIDATQVRQAFFLDRKVDIPFVDPMVAKYLESWELSRHYLEARADAVATDDYRRRYGEGPFLTVDALCKHRGRILMIQRSRRPGLGLWALPGGFLNPRERMLDAAIRELHEETNLPVSVEDLKKTFHSSCVIDDPGRDPRAHIVTKVHVFELDDLVIRNAHLVTNIDTGEQEISVKAADDAAAVRWFKPCEITRLNTFAGHYHMIKRSGAI